MVQSQATRSWTGCLVLTPVSTSSMCHRRSVDYDRPHTCACVFSCAVTPTQERALQVLDQSTSNEDVLITFCGHSGSGKSTNARAVLSYLTNRVDREAVAGTAPGPPGAVHAPAPSPMGARLLHALALIEAFGNAKTRRNPNARCARPRPPPLTSHPSCFSRACCS
jgi:myosin heavy subunit